MCSKCQQKAVPGQAVALEELPKVLGARPRLLLLTGTASGRCFRLLGVQALPWHWGQCTRSSPTRGRSFAQRCFRRNQYILYEEGQWTNAFMGADSCGCNDEDVVVKEKAIGLDRRAAPRWKGLEMSRVILQGWKFGHCGMFFVFGPDSRCNVVIDKNLSEVVDCFMSQTAASCHRPL